jgi:hypothetical protein
MGWGTIKSRVGGSGRIVSKQSWREIGLTGWLAAAHPDGRKEEESNKNCLHY